MKALSIISLLFLLVLASCNNQTTPQVKSVSNNLITKSLSDTISVEDTLQTKNERTEVLMEKISTRDTFLLKPFDLYKFKRKVGQSNSGGAGKKTYRFKPEYKGLYYSFFLFSNLNGYMGSTKQDTLHQEDGLTITTYKPVGKYQNEYFDPTEELIEVEAKFNNFDLPELAFVGLNTTKIKEQLGNPSFEKNNCFVYTFRDRALILKIENGSVNWLRYVHLKSELTSDKTFDQLYIE
jgi:hypothetical protein